MKKECENCKGKGRMYKKMGSMLDQCPVCHGDKVIDTGKPINPKGAGRKAIPDPVRIDVLVHKDSEPIIRALILSEQKKYTDPQKVKNKKC